MTLKMSSAFREAGRWLLECIESFPIPIEDALWAQAYGYPDAVQRVRAARPSKFRDVWENPRHAANSH